MRLADGRTLRCEHATALVKGAPVRAVIGDIVEVSQPDDHDTGIIDEVEPRRTQLVRKDPAERSVPQVLAANFDLVLVAEPVGQVNLKRLERELVLAHGTGADVGVVLTKADLAASPDEVERAVAEAQGLAGSRVLVLVESKRDPASIERIRSLIAPDRMAVLIGKSGVGKSSLVNLLAGSDVRQVGTVRDGDGKGRHTTVSRAVVPVAGGGFVVDMPGVRGLGLWDADAGIEAAFPDVEELAAQCRFRDCKHEDEPGCAVRAAVEAGELAPARLASYQGLKRENAQMLERRDEARHLRGEKASDRRKRAAGRRGAGGGRKRR